MARKYVTIKLPTDYKLVDKFKNTGIIQKIQEIIQKYKNYDNIRK